MCSWTKEIITLQVGHYSNFIGTHWLNLQEASFIYDQSTPTDLNHDVLFHEGKLPNNQEYYVPRLLIIDGKGSLGSLPVLGTLYKSPPLNPASSHAFWGGKVDLYTHPFEEKNEFLKTLEVEDAKYLGNVDEDKDVCLDDLEALDPSKKEEKIFDLSDKVKVWSDFLRPHLHPKTIFLLEDVIHDEIHNESNESWAFGEGTSIFNKEKTQEEVMDRIRLLAEACGSMQGFHLLCDIHDGMGGIGAGLLQCLADEYSSKDVFTFASCPPQKGRNSTQMSLFLTNVIQAYTEFFSYSSLVLPLSLNLNICQPASDVVRWPHISYNEMNAYETSSLLASFLETISVPWRIKSSPFPMTHLANFLTPLGKKVVNGGLAFPVGLYDDVFLFDWFDHMSHPSCSPTPDPVIHCKSVGAGWTPHSQRLVDLSVIRGIAQNRLTSARKRVKFDTAWQMYEYFVKKDNSRTSRDCRLFAGARDPLKTTIPFPQIFTTDVTENGFLKPLGNLSCQVTSVPAAANLQQGDSVERHLKDMAEAGSRIIVARLPGFTGDAMENWKNAFETFVSASDTGGKHISNPDDSDSE